MGWGFYTSTGALKDAEYTGSEFPVGTITDYAGSTAPVNWLLCDGSAVNRTTYSDLFAVIGTTYGAPGSTTFSVPNSTGKIIYAIPRISRSSETSVYEFPIGTTVGAAGTTAPTGWLLCDGSAVSRTAYADLFAVVGTYYGTGDGSTTFNVPNITGNIIYAQSLSTRINGTTPPQYVTSLPSSPIDGQEIYYAADATNGVIWHLRYRSGSSSSYKWEFVGGGSLTNAVLTSQSTTSLSSVDLSTVGPSVTPPLAGDYIIRWGCIATPSTSALTVAAMVIGFGGSYPADGNAGTQWVATSQFANTTTSRISIASEDVKTALSASTLIRARYYQNQAGGASFANRFLTVTPVRVG
jgi:microcystin-dependent protein